MNKGTIISLFANSIKEVSADTVYPRRYLWNLFYTVYQTLVKRDADNKTLYSNSEWKTYCLPLEKVSPILCTCLSYPVDCDKYIYRTKCKVPSLLDSKTGPIYRFISTVDNSKEYDLVSPTVYKQKTKVRFNKAMYTFYHDGYFWFPNSEYPMILISGIFNEESVYFKEFLECTNTNTNSSICTSKLQEGLTGPDYLVYPAIQMALNILFPTKGIQKDEHPNTNSSQHTISQP